MMLPLSPAIAGETASGAAQRAAATAVAEIMAVKQTLESHARFALLASVGGGAKEMTVHCV